MKERGIVGISQAAQLLGVHPNTLRKWADDGIIPHIKRPCSYPRFAVEDQERFRQAMEAPAVRNML